MNDSTFDQRVAGIERARNSAIQALERTLSQAILDAQRGKVVSEAAFRDQWLVELRREPAILPTGWYAPPPDGIAVRFATGERPERMSYLNLRHDAEHPAMDRSLDPRDGLAYLYASPVDRETGMFGDIGGSSGMDVGPSGE